jgi:hypothetical protein
MIRTIPETMPKLSSQKKRDKYGARIELIDRRREAWSMRISGCSYAQIAKTLGVGIATAHKDCQIAEEQFGEIALQPEVVREGLMALHGKLNGALLASLMRQMEDGQIVSQLNEKGEVVSATRKNWPAPQIAAELGRNLQRMAGLAGLDTAPVDGGSQTNTTIVLQAPADGPSFQSRYEDAQAATVDATAVEAPPEPGCGPDKQPLPMDLPQGQ